ncbi:MAG: hypothetical protein QM831_30980 [Kofleriaceae bacterium]
MKLALVVVAACGGGDPATTIDAASCAHNADTPVAVGTIDVGSSELSGLAISRTIDNLLWTHGDSGGTNDIYGVNATNAAALGTLHVKGATNTDWEDIATAPCGGNSCIYVSDTGDNDLARTDVSIYEVVEPTSQPIGTIDVTATQYLITYPDGPHDMEALFVDPRDGVSYGITKIKDKTAQVFRMPRVAGGAAQPAVQLGTLTIPASDPRVTAADMAVDACSARILVRTYGPLYELRGTASASVVDLIGGALATMPVAAEAQGEAVAYSADGHAYFTTSEGEDPVLSRVDD